MSFPLSCPARLTVVGLLVMTVGTRVSAGQPGKLKPDVERGERIYLENCWHCHGKRGLGDGPLAEAGPVAAPALAGRVPEDREPWTTIIHRGQESMPAFGPVFDRHDARRVLVWLDSLDPETGDGPSIEDKESDEPAPDEAKAADKSKDDAPAAEATKPDDVDKPEADQPTPGSPPPAKRAPDQ